MKEITVKELLEAGAHFGHQVSKWNPKMKPFIYTARNGIHIINLEKTVELGNAAYKFIMERIAEGGDILYVGTKRQASDVIRQEAEKVGMYHVSHRWLGGTLTNFKTLKQSINKLEDLTKRRDGGEFEKLKKKEALLLGREITKLESSLGGIRKMTKLPSIVFILDPTTEHLAKKEAIKLRIPIVAVVDTNGDPNGINYLIPANDDAIGSIQLLVSFITDACSEGVSRRSAQIREKIAEEEKLSARPREKKLKGKAKAYVAKDEPVKKVEVERI